jgi:hypothetical protein
MRISAILSIAALFLAGCASAPPIPKIGASPGDRVGVLVDVGDNPSHAHVGTTVFNNFYKKYPYQWKLGPEITRSVESAVKNAGFAVVDLRSEGLRYADVSGLVQIADDKWQIAAGKEGAARRLRDQLRLKAVIVVKEAKVLAALECGGGPCSERYTEHSGLYTRSIFGLTAYHAVAAYEWNVIVLDPVVDIAKAEPMLSMLSIPATRFADFKEPADFKNLTEAEFAPVRSAVMRFVDYTSMEAVKALNAK